jgi:hypothetical protein
VRAALARRPGHNHELAESAIKKPRLEGLEGLEVGTVALVKMPFIFGFREGRRREGKAQMEGGIRHTRGVER